jgi:hypothetical protein
VTGGALGQGPHERPCWFDTGREYRLPVKVLSKVFRGKFVAGLEHSHARGELTLPEALQAPGAFSALLAQLRRTRWITDCKQPFAGPEQVFKYLGRYTHRVGLSNKRLLDVTDEAVTIATRDGKTATMAPEAFIRRLLTHVLPKGYVKRAAMRELTGIDLTRCRVCGGEHLGRWRLLGFGMKQETEPSSRGPPFIGSPP